MVFWTETMESDFRQALEQIRAQSKTDVELGTFFESLTKVFLENDPIRQQEYKSVWRYEDWAKGR